MSESSTVKARDFANELIRFPGVDWISITDNAGGNPQLAPTALGKPILYAGKEVVIHLTCKDLNRNGLESEAWLLHSEGFNNVLAMTGDFPIAGATASRLAAVYRAFGFAAGRHGSGRLAIPGGGDGRRRAAESAHAFQLADVPRIHPVAGGARIAGVGNLCHHHRRGLSRSAQICSHF